MVPDSLIKMAIVEYPILQAIRRHFSLKQLRLSLIMEVLVTRKKRGGRTQTGIAFQPIWLLRVTYTGVALAHTFAYQFKWKYVPLKRLPPFRRVRGYKSSN